MKPEELHEVTVKQNGKVLPKHVFDPSRVTYVIETIGQWRKANAIHQWFVDNVQGGEDDCREHWVSGEKLQELLHLIDRVLESCELIDGEIANGYTFQDGKRIPCIEKGKIIKDSSLAAELLPTSSGFFFGSTEYDQWYFEDLKLTKKILEDALEDPDGEFEYISSW